MADFKLNTDPMTPLQVGAAIASFAAGYIRAMHRTRGQSLDEVFEVLANELLVISAGLKTPDGKNSACHDAIMYAAAALDQAGKNGQKRNRRA